MSHGFIGPAMMGPYYERVRESVDAAARALRFESEDMRDAHQRDKKADRKKVYTNVATRSCGMVVLMVFALDAGAVSGIESGEVGLGVSGMSNKSAVGIRLKYGETEVTFVAAHLAAMEWGLERRNEDWKNIVKGLVLEPENGSGAPKALREGGEQDDETRGLLEGGEKEYGIFKPTSHLFLAGDLNYRTSSVSPLETDFSSSFPQPNHAKDDPQHYSALFLKDQLTAERAAGRTMHGLSEFPVTFPPTYKYDVHTHDLKNDEEIDDNNWGWAPHRWPSWTDRILYLDLPPWFRREYPEAKIALDQYTSLPLFPMSDHKAVVLSVKVPALAIPEPDEIDRDEAKDPRVAPPFEREPEWRAKRAKARKEELTAGILGFLTTTWEGWCIAVGTLGGIVAGYFLLRAALDI